MTDHKNLSERLHFEANAMRAAMEGVYTDGTYHLLNWQDKPHRVVYDACKLIDAGADALESLQGEVNQWKEDYANSMAHQNNAYNQRVAERDQLRAEVSKWMALTEGNIKLNEHLTARLTALEGQKPVAYRAWFDADNGARWLFSLWPEEEKLDVTWQPLFLAAGAAPNLTTCNCRWDGEKQVQQCTLHEAHVDAIHEWAERAKTAEAAQAAPKEQK